MIRTNSGRDILPEVIADESELNEILTRPGQVLVEFMPKISSPLVILGAAGKMGPTLAVLARRAAAAAGAALEVIAVSRFSDAGVKAWLEAEGVRTLALDLMSEEDMGRLPDCSNLVYMVGQKFGTTENPSLTWVVNTLLPARVLQRYPQARISAFSTGNVYPNERVAAGGVREDHALMPLGEYANSAVARERIFEFFSRRQGTRVATLRLSYAVELRYGILSDIAWKVQGEESIDLSNGYFNCIWQGDANEMALRSLALASSPAEAWNLTGPILSVREVAAKFGELLGKTPRFSGQESEMALLTNTERLSARLGDPAMPLEVVMRWVAAWVRQGGRNLGKPTHFETTDGRY